MAWRDSLRTASFRGVSFQIEAAGHEGGRRIALHEFPQRDTPYAEDLGRKARLTNIEAFVIGPNYMVGRDALIGALDAAGAATLVHPYLGALSVVVDRYRLMETTDEGGLARFSISFLESGRQTFPTAILDTAYVVSEAVLSAVAMVEDAFAVGYAARGFPAFVADEAVTIAGQAFDLVERAGAILRNSGEPLYAVARAVGAARDRVVTLAREPENYATTMCGLAALMRASAATPRAAIDALKTLLLFAPELEPIGGTTASRRRQLANRPALINLLRRSAALEIARAAAAVDLTSYDEAAALRDEIAGWLDELQLAAGDAVGDSGDPVAEDAVYQAIGRVRMAVIRDLTARGGSLERVYRYTPAATEPALVLAYRLYGDASRGDEIVTRNRIRHPGFVPGGVALEVLTDG